MIKILDKENMQSVTDPKILMELAGFDWRMGYEAVGVQDDGTPVVFDKCGNFGYLDSARYQAVFVISAD